MSNGGTPAATWVDEAAGVLRYRDSAGVWHAVGSPAPAVWAATTAYSAYQSVQLPTGGWAYSTVDRTSGATFDQTEEDAWTFIPGGHYKSVIVNGASSRKCPKGITAWRIRLKGGGAQGGGGGSSTTVNTAGGGGGGAGAVLDAEVTGLTAGTSYNYVVGAGGSGAGGGGASGGNAGTSGANGADTTHTIAGVVYTAKGGGRGASSGANSATVVGGGLVGFPTKSTVSTYLPGCGGPSGSGATPSGPVAGGASGVAATTTGTNQGGTGGAARTSPGAAIVDPTGTTGTTAGANGTTATEPGCGGGGGGAGANGGAGGAGGAGADGQIEWWF